MFFEGDAFLLHVPYLDPWSHVPEVQQKWNICCALEDDTGRKFNPNEYFQSKHVKVHLLS